MKNEISQILSEVREGLSIAKPHGSLIYSGEQTLILLSKLYKNKIGKLLYLLEGNSLCYGIIKLNLPYKIRQDEFNELSEKHKVLAEERKKWWPTKEVLYAYKFDIIKLFDEPRKVAFFKDIQTFIDDFKFLDEKIKHRTLINKQTRDINIRKFISSKQSINLFQPYTLKKINND